MFEGSSLHSNTPPHPMNQCVRVEVRRESTFLVELYQVNVSVRIPMLRLVSDVEGDGQLRNQAGNHRDSNRRRRARLCSSSPKTLRQCNSQVLVYTDRANPTGDPGSISNHAKRKVNWRAWSFTIGGSVILLSRQGLSFAASGKR